MRKNYQPTSEQGAIAIYLSIVIGILLLISTTAAAKLQVSELNQSSQVDRSDQAYYAAEAGIEDAVRIIDSNPNLPVDVLINTFFPSSAAKGDQAVLDNINSLIVTPDLGAPEIGTLAWRNRRVIGSAVTFSGVQYKDSTVQIDTTSLRRRCAGSSVPAGDNGLDCDGSNIFSKYKGLRYCWTPNTTPAFSSAVEFTIASYQTGNIGNISTEKFIVPTNASAGFTSRSTMDYTIKTGPLASPYKICVEVEPKGDRRYVTRTRAIFPNAQSKYVSPNTTDPDGTQNSFSLTYQAKLLHAPHPYPLYVPNDSLLIDVVGQSGDIRRRLVAKKIRNGRLIGIFDYMLFSGDPVKPLCKSGVQQQKTAGATVYDEFCDSSPINNS